MKKPGTIQKDFKAKPSQDYNLLKEKGLSYVQELSGKIWTDYNAHDPGVTILEQFCYGITELGFKTDFPIEDLLTTKKAQSIDTKKNSFFSPAEVFSSHPVTANDFRKLIIDTFPEVQNCWIEPAYSLSGEEAINGLYQLEILPSLSFQKRLKNYPKEGENFLSKLSDFLFENRNLCEDFDPPILLSPLEISLNANIEVNGDFDVDRLMAEILFVLEVYLYHPVAFASLEELIKDGNRMEDIFSGPRLKRGFIRDSELKPRSRELYTEKIQQLISKINGVKKCWSFGFLNSENSEEIRLPEGSYAAINTNFYEPTGVYSTIQLYVNGNLQRANKNRVADLLLDFWSKNYRVYQVDLYKENIWGGQLNGKFRNPSQYHSIQHHFPGIYGLSKDGLPSREPLERHAKVRQLKGYLMLFEKHLANYLAQLGHLVDFFDPTLDAEKGSYFGQEYETNIGKDELEMKANLGSDFSHGKKNPQTGETSLEWLRRKNRVLDHLLARFGEQFNSLPYQLSLKLNLFESEEQFLSIMLLQKADVLSRIPTFNYSKNRASLESKQTESINFVLLDWLNSILGFEKTKTGLIPDFFPFKSDDEIIYSNGIVRTKTQYDDFIQKYRPLSKKERSFSQLDQELSSGFSLGKITIKDLFERTLDPENYWISKTSKDSEEVEVLFQKSDSTWVSVWEGKKVENALQAIGKNIAFFRQKNIESEGMYLIDHILLKSILSDSEFGFEIRDEWGNSFARSKWFSSHTERSNGLKAFYQSAINKEFYEKTGDQFFIRTEEGDRIISFDKSLESDLDYLFDYTSDFAYLFAGEPSLSGQLSLLEIEKLRMKGTLHDQGVYRQRSLIFLRKLANGTIVGEDFFNLKSSLVFPDWPARFQERYFRHFVETEVKERVPAHLQMNVYWIDFKEFRRFEPMFLAWQKAFLKDRSDKDTVSKALELYKFLSELEKGGEGG
ncbi:hypothetical protein [Algoriphagus formosus]|uniref:Uncharacterized protein n=1 Tax=Algoriphagus formosus TaxID=2007308 RepID=A0A4R5VE74_9BACT|nr:hypothetical protein [Algoriphagus aquimaris]TDK50628.1 hypothetical protein E1898_00890 [Algoriphagus aquimaris]